MVEPNSLAEAVELSKLCATLELLASVTFQALLSVYQFLQHIDKLV